MTKPNPLNIKRRKNHRSIGWPHHRQIRNQRHPQLIIPANTTTLLSTPTVWSAYLSLNKKRLLSDRAYLLIASTTVALSWSHWDSATTQEPDISPCSWYKIHPNSYRLHFRYFRGVSAFRHVVQTDKKRELQTVWF